MSNGGTVPRYQREAMILHKGVMFQMWAYEVLFY
jgi:hypothetical protein